MLQAVILVGGKGTRLQGLAGERPKPFIEIGGKPFLDYLIHHAACHGVRDVVLLAGHAAGWIEENYKCSVEGVRVRLRVEKTPMGTAGALLSAADILEPQFLLLNGDSVLNGNWAGLWPLLTEDTVIALAARKVPDTSRYGRLSIEGVKVTGFAEKGVSSAGLINGGVYWINRDTLMPLIDGPASFEEDIMPSLVVQERVKAVQVEGYFLDIGLPETLAIAKEALMKELRRRAVFFDRDNTLVEDEGYTHKVKDLKWKPGAIGAIKSINDSGRAVFVVTNQAGIARGLYTEEQMHSFHQAMQSQLLEYGAHIDGFYFSPFHPDGTIEGLSVESDCRKPGAGMLEQIDREHLIVKEGSFMIGDQMKDIECGHRFGVAAFLYESGPLDEFCRNNRVL